MYYNRKLVKKSMAAGKRANKGTPFFGKSTWALVDFDELPNGSAIKNIRENINKMYLEPSSEGGIYYRFVLQNNYSTPTEINTNASKEQLNKELQVRQAFIESLYLNDLSDDDKKTKLFDIYVDQMLKESEKARKEIFDQKKRARYKSQYIKKLQKTMGENYNFKQLFVFYSDLIQDLEQKMEPIIGNEKAKADPSRFSFDIDKFNKKRLALVQNGKDIKNPHKGKYAFDPSNKKLLKNLYMRYAVATDDHPEVINNGEIAMIQDSLSKIDNISTYDPDSYIKEKINEHKNPDDLYNFYETCQNLGISITLPSWYMIGYNRYSCGNADDEITEITKLKDGNVNVREKIKKKLASLPEEQRDRNPLSSLSDDKLQQKINMALSFTHSCGGKFENYEEIAKDEEPNEKKFIKKEKKGKQTPSTPQGLLMQMTNSLSKLGISEKNSTLEQIESAIDVYLENYQNILLPMIENSDFTIPTLGEAKANFFNRLEFLESKLYNSEYSVSNNEIDSNKKKLYKLELLYMKYYLMENIKDNIASNSADDPKSYLYMYDEICKMFLDYHIETFGQATLLRSSAVREDGYLADTQNFKNETKLVREPFLPAPRSDDMTELTLSARYAYSTRIPQLAKTTLGGINSDIFEKYKDKILEKIEDKKEELEYVTVNNDKLPELVSVTDVNDYFEKLKSVSNNKNGFMVLTLRVEGKKLQYFCGLSKCTRRWLRKPKTINVILPDGTKTQYHGYGTIRAPVGKAGTAESLLGKDQLSNFLDEENEANLLKENSVGENQNIDNNFKEGIVKRDSWEELLRYVTDTYGIELNDFKPPTFKDIPDTIFKEIDEDQKGEIATMVEKNKNEIIMTVDSRDTLFKILTEINNENENPTENPDDAEPFEEDVSMKNTDNTNPLEEDIGMKNTDNANPLGEDIGSENIDNVEPSGETIYTVNPEISEELVENPNQ